MTLARAEYFSTDCEYQGVQVPLPVALIQSGSGLSRMSVNVSCSTHQLKSPDRIAEMKKAAQATYHLNLF